MERTHGRQREKQEKSIRPAHFFPAWQGKGIYCGGMMIYVRGRQGASGTKVFANND